MAAYDFSGYVSQHNCC